MIRLLRRVLRISAPTVTRADAIDIAKSECIRRGWPWREPVRFQEELTSYRITTNARFKGGNVNIVIDITTGNVKKAAYARR